MWWAGWDSSVLNRYVLDRKGNWRTVEDADVVFPYMNTITGRRVIKVIGGKETVTLDEIIRKLANAMSEVEDVDFIDQVAADQIVIRFQNGRNVFIKVEEE